jgi:hypothetical protein
MSAFFEKPPKPPPLPALKPAGNTALTAQIQAQNRRRGGAATIFGQTSDTTARASSAAGGNTLTGN